MTHYTTLGVEKTADADTIKKAYRKLASQHHPDKGGDTKKFQEVQAAYDTLSDKDKREQYDHELEYGGRQSPHHNQWNFNSGGMNEQMAEMLRRQFGFQFGGGFRQQKPQNRDVRISMHVSLLDTLSEQVKTIKITLPSNKNEEIEVKIPRGISTGDTIKYSNLGDYSIKDAPRADLYVQFIVEPHPKFHIHGVDLVYELSVNCIEAMVGCEKEIEGLEGNTFKLTIPAGTQYGTKFGIPNQGLYSTHRPGRGRLIVIADVYVPKNLTEEQKEILRSMAISL